MIYERVVLNIWDESVRIKYFFCLDYIFTWYVQESDSYCRKSVNCFGIRNIWDGSVGERIFYMFCFSTSNIIYLLGKSQFKSQQVLYNVNDSICKRWVNSFSFFFKRLKG
jgi:hypothetical protein